MPFTQLLGHRARRHREGGACLVCSAHNLKTVCSGRGPRPLKTPANVVFGLGYFQKHSPRRDFRPCVVWR